MFDRFVSIEPSSRLWGSNASVLVARFFLKGMDERASETNQPYCWLFNYRRGNERNLIPLS